MIGRGASGVPHRGQERTDDAREHRHDAQHHEYDAHREGQRDKARAGSTFGGGKKGGNQGPPDLDELWRDVNRRLAGLFGRKIASLPGYRFSDALKNMNIVWTPETVSQLFELGPNAYTPGTKMPEQRIGSADDRKALTDFLARATAK